MNSNNMENEYNSHDFRSIIKNELISSEKIIIKRSNIHRWGVFAKNDIKKMKLLKNFHIS